jgi:hypothetical protein
MDKSRNSGREPKCRALSAGGGLWQSKPLEQAWARVAIVALLLAAPAAATPGGDLDTLPAGDYICELPGDATGLAGLHMPKEDFTVVTASSYRSGGEMGSYLLVEDQLTMTGGPLEGKRYQRQSEGFVRLLNAQGNPGDLRCVRRKRNNS